MITFTAEGARPASAFFLVKSEAIRGSFIIERSGDDIFVEFVVMIFRVVEGKLQARDKAVQVAPTAVKAHIITLQGQYRLFVGTARNAVATVVPLITDIEKALIGIRFLPNRY